MFCSNCGTEVNNGEKFCPSCGAPTAASEKIKAAAGEVINSAEKELSSAIDEVEASISKVGSKGSTGTDDSNTGNNNASQNAKTGSDAASGSDSNNAVGIAISTSSNNTNGDNSMNSSTGKVRLKDDRGIVSYVLLDIITCGIYGFYFIHKMAQEINIACDGDGTETPGLMIFILLSIVTCGFYAYYWYYKLGNRLASNASRYNLSFEENGTTVLLWCVVGMVICGIGPLIGMYILIKNSNAICGAYNRQNGLQ